MKGCSARTGRCGLINIRMSIQIGLDVSSDRNNQVRLLLLFTLVHLINQLQDQQQIIESPCCMLRFHASCEQPPSWDSSLGLCCLKFLVTVTVGVAGCCSSGFNPCPACLPLSIAIAILTVAVTSSGIISRTLSLMIDPLSLSFFAYPNSSFTHHRPFAPPTPRLQRRPPPPDTPAFRQNKIAPLSLFVFASILFFLFLLIYPIPA